MVTSSVACGLHCLVLGSAEKMGLAWPTAGWKVCFQPISSSTVTNAFGFCFQYDSLI